MAVNLLQPAPLLDSRLFYDATATFDRVERNGIMPEVMLESLVEANEARAQAFLHFLPHQFSAAARADIEASLLNFEPRMRSYIKRLHGVSRRDKFFNIDTIDFVMPDKSAFYARSQVFPTAGQPELNAQNETFMLNDLYLQYLARLIDLVVKDLFAFRGVGTHRHRNKGVVALLQYFATDDDADQEDEIADQTLLNSQLLDQISYASVLHTLQDITDTFNNPSRNLKSVNKRAIIFKNTHRIIFFFRDAVIRLVLAQAGTGHGGEKPLHLRSKRFVWSSATEGFCLQKSAIMAYAYRLPYNERKAFQRESSSTFNNALKKCCRTLGQQNPCGSFNDIPDLADYFRCNITVLDAYQYHTLFATEKEEYEVTLFLLLDQLHKHFMACYSPQSLKKNQSWCFTCKKLVRSYSSHRCRNLCWACKRPDPLKNHFSSDSEFITHEGPEGCWRSLPADCYEPHCQHCKGHNKLCPTCKESFFDAALSRHPQAITVEQHQQHCGQKLKKCSNCLQLAPKDHPCKIIPLTKLYDHSKDKRRLYVFDIESYRKDDGQQVPNVISVREVLKSKPNELENPYIFRAYAAAQDPKNKLLFSSLESFADWLIKQTMSDFVAHNLRGYDGTLICGFLRYELNQDIDIVYNGLKIMSAKFKSNCFYDSLNHLPCSLDAMPKLLGLSEYESLNFRKGFFPYKFDTLENQGYVGPIPAPEFFERENMSDTKKAAFDQWYEEKQSQHYYDLHREAVLYCEQDTLVLSLCMGEYRRMVLELVSLDPLRSMTLSSLVMKIYRTHYIPADGIPVLTAEQEIFARRAFKGGRTEVFQTQVHNTPIAVIDVISMYPAVQYFDSMPYEPLESIVPAEPCSQLGPWFYQPDVQGFLECDIEPPQPDADRCVGPDKIALRFYKPLLGESKDGKYRFDLCPKVKQVFCLNELRRAVELGYSIQRWYRADLYSSRQDLFKSYVRAFIKLKVESSAPPHDIPATVALYAEQLDVHLDAEKCAEPENPGFRSFTKLCLNGLWGKLGQRTFPEVKLCNLPEYQGLMARHAKEDINIVSLNVDPLAPERIQVKYFEQQLKHQMTRFKTNVAIAAYVTSSARLRLYAVIGDPRMAGRVLYCDTDSCIFIIGDPEVDFQPAVGSLLGQWEIESKYRDCCNFVCIGPKFYMLYGPEGSYVASKKATKGVHADKQGIFTPDVLLSMADSQAQVTVSFKHVKRTKREVFFNEAKKVIADTTSGVSGKRRKAEGSESFILEPHC